MAGNDHNPDGRTGSPPPSNVVHLRPRQWLGSEDELIPIGGASPEAAGERPPARDALPARDVPAGHAGPRLGTAEESVPVAPDRAPPPDTGGDIGDAATPWAASDFWGEDAAHVHDALEAPVAAPRGAKPASQPVRRPTAQRQLLSAPRLGAIAIAAAAIIAVAVSSFGSTPAPLRGAAPGSSIRATAATRAPSAPATDEAATTTAARLRLTAAASRHRSTPRPHVRDTHTRRASTRHEHPAPVAATTAVRYVTATPVSTPAPTTDRPTQPTIAPPPAPAGPTGTVSLIGAGTSSSG